MNVLQALGVKNSNDARALLAARSLYGCRVYGGRLVHIRHATNALHPLCNDTIVRNTSWMFTDDGCYRCATLALRVEVEDE